MRRLLSTAIVRLKALNAASTTTTHSFNSNGVLVGAALSAALQSPEADVSNAFLRACATAETPLKPAAEPLTPENADYLFDVTAAREGFRIFCVEGGTEPVYDGDLQGFTRFVARGFGQC